VAKKKKKKKKAKELAPPLWLTDHSMPKVGIHFREGFDYTTPSAHPPRTAQDRRNYGCEESNKRFTGRLKDGRLDSYCKITSPPCEDRAGCPVQLVWVKGKPHLRFCIEPKKPGFLVPVGSPEEADKLSRKACRAWPRQPEGKKGWPKGYFEKNAPEIVEAARAGYPESPWGTPGLGADRPDDLPWIMQGERGKWVTFLLPIVVVFGMLATGKNKEK
jgi:hypothetical protein